MVLVWVLESQVILAGHISVLVVSGVIGGSQHPPKPSFAIISGMGKATDSKFAWYIHRSIWTKTH